MTRNNVRAPLDVDKYKDTLTTRVAALPKDLPESQQKAANEALIALGTRFLELSDRNYIEEKKLNAGFFRTFTQAYNDSSDQIADETLELALVTLQKEGRKLSAALDGDDALALHLIGKMFSVARDIYENTGRKLVLAELFPRVNEKEFSQLVAKNTPDVQVSEAKHGDVISAHQSANKEASSQR